MRTAIIIFILIALIAYPHIKYSCFFNKGIPVKDLHECDFATGDIIMTKYDEPSIYWAKNGFNLKPVFIKNITDSIQYYSQGHYTHCGIVIVLDKPYIYHLTDDICFDKIRGRYVTCIPSLVPLEEMLGYHGVLYHFPRRVRRHIPMEVIYNLFDQPQPQMQGNPFITVCHNAFKIGTLPKDKYVCADFAKRVLMHLGFSQNLKLDAPTNLTDIRKICSEECHDPVIIRTTWYEHTYE